MSDDGGGNDKTIHSALYRNPVPIDPEQHRHLRLGTFSDFSVTRQMHAVFIAATEFPLAALDFTIVFVDLGGTPSPIVLLGLAQHENLYLDGTRWDARYIPAFIRRYPFLPASVRGGERIAVLVDAAWEGISPTEGEPLFLENDQPAPALQRAMDFIHMFETEAQRTRAFCQRLAEQKLLKSMQVDATLPSGRHMAVDGFMTVDEERLKALPDATVIELHRNGMLALLNLHLASLANMRHLVERKGRLPEPAAPG
jgi:hypothetical protein